jgi:RHS repeat-associated protein
MRVDTLMTETSYYRARYYDPGIGRFLSEDPIRFWGGIDFFKYVGNSPANGTDPSGRVTNWPDKPPVLTLIPGGFIAYGYWCGPNWTGGRNEEYNPSHDHDFWYFPPIDQLDAACETHDKCFYSCRKHFACDQAARKDCMRQCNANLGNSALKLVNGNYWDLFFSPAGLLGAIMGDHDPDPGTNEHCGCKK